MLIAFAVLEQLEKLQARGQKEILLQQHRNNEKLQIIFKMSLGQDRYFVHPEVKHNSSVGLSAEAAWLGFVKLTEQLKNRNITGTIANTTTQEFLASCPAGWAKWFARILNHDLRIGVGKDAAKTVWGDKFLLDGSMKTDEWEFNGCSLAKKWEDVFKVKIDYPLAIEPKVDGERALLFAFPETDTIFVVTRGAKRREYIETVLPFKAQIMELCAALHPGPLFLDGEFFAKEWNSTSSIVRSTKNFDETAFLAKIRVLLFDWMPLSNYTAGRFELPWQQRKAELLRVTQTTKLQLAPIKFSANLWVLGHEVVYNDDELMLGYNACLDAGYEGVVAKVIDAPHIVSTKVSVARNKNLIKLKPEDTITVTISSVEAGEGKHAAVDLTTLQKVIKLVEPNYHTEGAYLVHLCEKPKEIALKIVNEISDEDRRIVILPGELRYRIGERLGFFWTKRADGKIIRVGGGFSHRYENDQRMDFWARRQELVGKKIDIKIQLDAKQVGAGRFNRFVRFREDLD